MLYLASRHWRRVGFVRIVLLKVRQYVIAFSLLMPFAFDENAKLPSEADCLISSMVHPSTRIDTLHDRQHILSLPIVKPT